MLAGTVFDAGFAVLCAVFRRGERGFASWDGLTGTVLTRCLQCSAQCFAGASGDVLAGTVFDAGFAVFCAGASGCVCGDLLAGMWREGVCERGCFFLKLLD